MGAVNWYHSRMSRLSAVLRSSLFLFSASVLAILVAVIVVAVHNRSSTVQNPPAKENPTLSLLLADYSRSSRAAFAHGKTPPDQFWSEWLHHMEGGMQRHPDDPLRQQGWAVLVSIHNQLEQHGEGFESAWAGLGEAVDPRDIAARCADVIAAVPFLVSLNDAEIIRLADERRQDAHDKLWELIARQGNEENHTPAEWMDPATRSCFANQFALLRARGEHRKASELEMELALALSQPQYRDHEGLHAGDHALNAMIRAPTSALDQLSVSFMDVMETTNPLREKPAFFLGAMFESTSLDPIPIADRLLPFLTTAPAADELFATARLARLLSNHPDAEGGSPDHNRWREVAGDVLAVSELTVLLPAERALSDLSTRSPNHPDLPGLLSDARTSALLLAVKLENDVKHDIAALIRLDGYGMRLLAENIQR